MQRDPRPIEFAVDEALHGHRARIEGVCVDAAPLQRGEHGIAAQQGDLALGGVAAQQHGDLAEVGALVTRRAADWVVSKLMVSP